MNLNEFLDKNDTLMHTVIDHDSNPLNRHTRHLNCSLNANKKKQNEKTLFKREFNIIFKEIQKITKKIENEEDERQKVLEWKFAGIVLDRLFLYIFTILTIIFTCTILLTAQNFFKLN